jgi:tetratricopeptide (TPR) repeat protein
LLGIGFVALAAFAAVTNVRWFDMSPAVAHKDVWNVANCFEKRGQLNKAIEEYQRFLQLNPEFADGWTNLGRVYFRQSRSTDLDPETRDRLLKQALACFEQAAKRADWQQSAPWSNLGYCRLKLERAEEALAAFDTALKRNPDNRTARNGRAEALAALERTDEALAELDALLEADPDFVLALWTKASVLARGGKPAEARRLALRALQLAPSDAAEQIRSDPALGGVLGHE